MSLNPQLSIVFNTCYSYDRSKNVKDLHALRDKSHLLAIVVAELSKFKPKFNAETGFYDHYEWYARLKSEEPKLALILKVINSVNRSEIVKGQMDKPEYSAGVPFLPYVHKKYNDIPYSKWDFSESFLLANCGLALKKVFTSYHNMDIGDVTLQEYIENALNEGGESFNAARENMVHSVYSHFVNRCGIREIDILPQFVRQMYFRLWIFSNTNKYLIYDLDNLDYGDEVFSKYNVDVGITEVKDPYGDFDELFDTDKNSPW